MLYSLVVFSDAVIFFIFAGWVAALVALIVFCMLTFGFYRTSLLKVEWRISMVVALSLFINNYSLVWPYTTYGLYRLEQFGIQEQFNYSYQFIWCLLSFGLVPLFAFIRMSISIAQLKELNRRNMPTKDILRGTAN